MTDDHTRLTPNAVIQRFDDLTIKLWAPHLNQVIHNGDDWTGQQVVRLADVLSLVGWIVYQLDQADRLDGAARRGR